MLDIKEISFNYLSTFATSGKIAIAINTTAGQSIDTNMSGYSCTESIKMIQSIQKYAYLKVSKYQ